MTSAARADMGADVMGVLRHILLRHRALAALLIAAALCMKALVPAGFMVGEARQTFTILVCADASGTGTHAAREVTVPKAPAKQAGTHAHEICPFSSLGFAALGGADPIQLAAALAFVLALGFVAAPALRLVRRAYLVPPACGPPASVLTA
ncbi:MAG: hypothetical protein RIS94_1173 [Pseudomonadota bacterium]